MSALGLSLTTPQKHQKREIKIPQVDSVDALLNPILKQLPSEMMVLNHQLSEAIKAVRETYPNSQAKTCSNNKKNLNDSDGDIKDYMNTSSMSDANQGEFVEMKDEQSLLNDEIFKECFTKSEQENFADDFDVYQNIYLAQNNQDVNEELIDLSQKILTKIYDLSGRMNRFKIHSIDLFKNKRKTYSILDKSQKDLICKIVDNFGAKTTANSLNLSIKSLKRWKKTGIERKKGGGRKILDPKMEKELYFWVLSQRNMGKKVTTKNIKEKAKELSTCKSFLASKGWFEKYRKKYHIKPDTHIKK